jgi:hypothetical protein
MSEIVWTQGAIADLNRHYDFIKFNDADVATRAVQAIISSAEVVVKLKNILFIFSLLKKLIFSDISEHNSEKLQFRVVACCIHVKFKLTSF